jgi:hypothetical protein
VRAVKWWAYEHVPKWRSGSARTTQECDGL